jgi:outer membrane cobalamin receptor
MACVNAAAAQTTEATLPETIVTGTREPEPRSAEPIAASRIDGATIQEVRPTHPSEILNRVPGVIVTQTNGEGSIVGIRQPFGTAPLNLYLQDNVPVQPTGYFNHNA